MLKSLRPQDRLYEGGQKQLGKDIRWLGELFALPLDNLTPYLLRRSGATWHFTHYGKLDLTASYGRWAQIKTARIYINEATVAVTQGTFSENQQVEFKMAAAVLRKFIRTFT